MCLYPITFRRPWKLAKLQGPGLPEARILSFAQGGTREIWQNLYSAQLAQNGDPGSAMSWKAFVVKNAMLEMPSPRCG